MTIAVDKGQLWHEHNIGCWSNKCRQCVYMYTTCGQKAWGQCVSTATNQSPSKHPLVLDMHLIFSTFHFIYLNFFSSRIHILLLYYASLVCAPCCVRCPVCASWGSPIFRAQRVSNPIQRSRGGQTPQPPFEMRGCSCQTEKTGGLSPFIAIKYLTAKYIYHRL